MNPQEKDFVKYLQSCKLPELQAGVMCPEEQKEFAMELDRLFGIIEKMADVAEAQVRRAAAAEKGRRW